MIPRGLYGMVDLRAEEAGRAGPLGRALVLGGARVLQLRMKGAMAAPMLAALQELRALAAEFAECKLIVNDRLDVALVGGADGVHLGQGDLPLRAARRIAPPGFIIGVSTHNEAQAEAALLGGADYIALGPIYETRTKADPDPVVGTGRLRALCRRTTTPVVAIGGITLDRVPEIAAAGAHAAALISAVNLAADIAAAAREVTRRFL